MKKVLILVLAISLVLSLVACNKNNEIINTPSEDDIPTNPIESTSPTVTNPLLFPVERLGFMGGNIGADGLVCGGDDGYIYYRSENDDWKLYKAKPDGSEKVKVSDRMPSNINVLDGWVYFLDYQEGFPIFRVRTNGADETKLTDGCCNNLYVAESGLYFDMRDEKNESHIYRADLDGGNMTLLFPEASLMNYFKGMIYLGATQLGVYDIETGTEKVLAETAVHNVSVDDSGIYYWAVDKGEFRCMNLDGSNDRLILSGGNFFNYCNGNLYYMGISENENGPCHVINRLNIVTNETVTLLEEANEFFNIHGEWVGVTFKQFFEHPETIDPDLMKPNAQGEVEIGESESIYYVFVSSENLYMRCSLRESILQTGKLDCIARLDNGITIWD